jgi:Ca-activated chloride channel homolog
MNQGIRGSKMGGRSWSLGSIRKRAPHRFSIRPMAVAGCSLLRFSRPASICLVIFLLVAVAPQGRAQQAAPPVPGEPQGNHPPAKTPAGYAIQRDVNLVVLHVSAMDGQGKFVPGLAESSFRVLEDGVPQTISVFRQEDAPVSIGLLIDNSESMFDKRAQVNAAALTFVKTSNPEDEEFVAHFNQTYFPDMGGAFTHNVGELQKALNQGEPTGATALYDAVVASLDHLQEGYHDKKVLLVVTDGEDNSSHESFHSMLEHAQRTNAIVYAIGLLGQENEKSAIHARTALLSLTQATGGSAYFPEGVDQVEMICARIARDIRHQYTVGYYPSNSAHDGSFRTVRVEVTPPASIGKVSVRTRTGYFAQRSASGN